jgi:hypothetical protein
MQRDLLNLENVTNSITASYEPSVDTLRKLILYANVVRSVKISENREVIFFLN